MTNISINLESSDYETHDLAWQQQCQQLYQQLNSAITEVEIKPQRQLAEDGSMGSEYIDLFHNILIYGTTTGAFAMVYDLLKLWLSQRQNANVILNYGDGNSIELKNLTKEKALKLIEQHKK
jgi:hypothetical protein